MKKNHDELISIEQAYQAMLLFWQEIWDRTGSEDIGAALEECKLVANGRSVDPARINDFRHLVRKLEDGELPDALFFELGTDSPDST